MSLSPFWISVAAVSIAAAAVDSVPSLIQEGDPSRLYGVAHLTSALKFTHGAFVCADFSSGRFYTLNRNGDLIASSKLEWPEDAVYRISDFDRFKDGTIVSSVLPSPFVNVSPLLAFLPQTVKQNILLGQGLISRIT